MRVKPLRKMTARLAFVIGLSLMVLGCLILVAAIVSASRLVVLPASFALIIGMSFAILAVQLKRSSLYLYVCAFLAQTGLLLWLVALNVLPIGLSRLWPLLTIFAGIALIPSARYRHGVPTFRYRVPALGFVALGSVLLVFSLDLVPFSFLRFFLYWWPGLLLLVGVLIFLISQNPRNRAEDHGS